MPVEVMLAKRRLRARQFEEFLARQQSDFSGQNFGLAHCHRRQSNIILGRFALCGDHIKRPRGTFEERLRSVQLDMQVTDLAHGQRVVARTLDATVNPRPRPRAHKRQRIGQRRLRDPGVDCRLDNLRDRTIQRREIGNAMRREYIRSRHAHRFEHHGSACRGPLAEARPVVDHIQARCALRYISEPALAFLVETQHRHEMCKQRTGRIELGTVDHIVVAVTPHARLQIEHVLRAFLGEAIAEALAAQYLSEEVALLLLSACQ